MNRDEMLMVIAMEECVELAKCISKAARFGKYNIPPGDPLNNMQRIEEEFTDLLAVMSMLGWDTIDRNGILAKRAKVEKYLAYSGMKGTLSE